MKYVFFGSPRFAKIILEKLIETRLPPLAIITSPDRRSGRKMVITPAPTKVVAEENNIPVFQPERLQDFELPNILKEADFFLVAAYAKIIPSAILDLPQFGTIGIHPSLLPSFRGSSPIQSVILSGEKETGVSIYKMDVEVDHGPVLGLAHLKDYAIDNLNYETLEEKLAVLGAETFIKIIPEYLKGSIPLLPQEEQSASFTRKFKTEDAFITEEDLKSSLNGGDTSKTISTLRKILAFSTEPVAWTILKESIHTNRYTLPSEKRIKLISAEIADQKLQITSFQIEGKNIVRF